MTTSHAGFRHANVFHGHVRRGRAHVCGLELTYPQHPHDESRAATVFVRAHELDVLRTPGERPSIAGRVAQINPAGAAVRVRVDAEAFGVLLTVDLPSERHRELGLAVGDPVHVVPRRVRVFVRDHAI